MTTTELAEHKSASATVERSAPVTPMEMLQLAVERGADLDQLQKLMDLHDRWEANEARKAFVAALASFKSEPPVIIKTRRASFVGRSGGSKTEYQYATLDNVSAIIGEALSKHGLSHTWKVAQNHESKEITVTCVLTHEYGHAEETTMSAMPDDSGSKNFIQQIGSTVTYLERYTLLAATGLAAADQDDDGDGGGAATVDEYQKEQIIALIRETQADTAQFCKYMGAENVDQIKAADFDKAIRALNKKKDKGAGS